MNWVVSVPAILGKGIRCVIENNFGSTKMAPPSVRSTVFLSTNIDVMGLGAFSDEFCAPNFLRI